MAAFLIVDGIIDNASVYEQYKLEAKPIVEQFGGEYLVRGGPMDVRETDLWTPSRIVLIRFPDVASATRFYDSEAYQAVLPISQTSARRTAVIVEGL